MKFFTQFFNVFAKTEDSYSQDSVNPTSGLPMIDSTGIDTGGNVFGGSNDISSSFDHSSSFSEHSSFDPHNY